MEIIVTANPNNLIAFADLNCGQVFRMVNADDARMFGEDCLCMKTDTGEFVTLACTECKQRNYDDYKNKKNDPDRIELNKYCPFCKKHTVHKETK